MALDKELELLEKLLKKRSDYNDLLQESKDLLEKSSDELDKERIALEALQKEQEKVNNLEKDRMSFSEKIIVKQEAITDKTKEQLDLIEDQIKRVKYQTDIIQKKYEKQILTQEQYEKEIENLALIGTALSEVQDIKKEEYNKEQKKLNISIAQTDALKKSINLLGITANLSENWLGSFEQLMGSTTNIGLTLKNIGVVVADVVHPTNLFGNALQFSAESTLMMAKEMDGVLASFNKTTGAGGKFNDVINDVRFGSSAAGVGLKESSDAVQALFENFNSFSQLSKRSQTEIARTTAELDRMGISSQTTAKTLDIATKALNMNIDEAMDAEKQIAATALELGLSPGMLADEFASSLPKLAQYGKQSTQIFKELASQSKATGIAIDSLIGISQQFDTFEGASQAAGKLNAILGGNLLNSTELLAATESERIDMLRQSVTLSGRNFNELSKFEKMAIASAAGIKDMNEASRLFGASSEEFDKVRLAQEAEALSTKTITDNAAKATSAQEKFNLAIQAFSIAALPVLTFVTAILDKFLQLNDLTGGLLAPLIIGFTGSLYALSKVYSIINGLLGTNFTLQKSYVAIKNSSIIATMKEWTINKLRVAQYQLEALWTDIVTLKNQAFNAIKNSTILLRIKDMILAAKEKVLSVAQTIATNLLTAGLTAYNAIKNLNILSTIKNIALMVLEEASTIALTVAFAAYEAIQWLVNVARNANILSTIKNLALMAAEEVATWAITAALVAYEIAQKVATVAMWLFNAALTANPIGLVVAAIALLIAGLVALVVYFDDINAWVQKVTGGFLDLWDVLLILTGPIGLMITYGRKIYENWGAIKGLVSDLTGGFLDIWDVLLIMTGPLGWFITAGKKIYENWDGIITGLSKLFLGLKDTVSSVFSGIMDAVKKPINFGIETINSVITKANVIPGVEIPQIPALAKGTTNFAGGLALVGENGPELVSLPPSANVLTNENTSKLAEAGSALKNAQSSEIVKQTEILEKTIEKDKRAPAEDKSKNTPQIPLILELDGRELGRVMINTLNKKMKLNLVDVG